MQTIVYLHKIVYNICMKIGIFGGTFNPPHNSHLQIALQAKQQRGLDKLLVFPCGDPPHKTTDVSAAHRLEMTRLAFGPFAEVCDYEILQQGKSYTYHTSVFSSLLNLATKLCLPHTRCFPSLSSVIVSFISLYSPASSSSTCTSDA